MNIAVVYTYPTPNNGDQYYHQADRFVRSYRNNPPLMDHQMIVVSNGGPPSGKAVSQFSWIVGTRFLKHDNSGLDIGAYQLAARSVSCDMMVFFGASAYIRGPGWLRRMANVFKVYSDGLFGCMGNQGGGVLPHVRTTGFWCDPRLINTHPMRVRDKSQRYPYEHGADGLTSWTLLNQRPVLIVGWKDIRTIDTCDSMPNGLHQGDQSNLIVGDRLSCPPFHHCE
jgi:hypothetical protein